MRFKNRHPGDGYHYAICDVCGFKKRAKDLILVQDKYNYLNGLLVCQEDYEETNPQSYIRAVKEKQLSDPRYIRSEPADNFVYISDADQIEADGIDPTGRNPSAPRHLFSGDITGTTIELRWLGPFDTGSSAISGYKIERESPVGGGFSTITPSTNSVATYYQDTGLSASTQYNYRVSAVNVNGTGTASTEFAVTTSS